MEGMTLEKLQVIIQAYTKPYRDELEKAKQKTASDMAQIERQTSRATARANGSMAKAGGIIRKALAIIGTAAIVAFGKSCIDLGSDLAEVQNVVDVTFGSLSRQVDAFSKNAITQFGLSELTAKKYMGTYGAMAKSFGIVEEAGYQMSASITGLTGDVASFYNLSTDEAYTKLKSIFTGETESLKELGVVMTQTALDQYALNNGFGKTTAKMTEQEKTMLRYQFVMSSLADSQGDFARTSQSWANQTRILSLQFESLKATIGQGLINAFTPVIQMVNTLLAKLQTLANYFKAFTVALFGDAGGGASGTADALGSAADSSGAVADNLGSAAGSAKKMKDYLLGIDELNIINPDEADSGGSGGSGGAGGGALDFGDLSGNWMESLEPDASELVDKICQAFKDGDYQLAGEYIGEGITNALRGIDWNSIYNSASNFGKGLAEFLNGLISPELFGAVGQTIAGALNTALHFLDSFGTEFDWVDFGESIAAGINEFFSTFDFILLADTINTWAKGILDTIITAINETDWKQVGNKIGTFLEQLDFTEIGSKIGKAIWGAINAGVELWKASFKAAPIETAILTACIALKFTNLGKFVAAKIAAQIALSLGTQPITTIIQAAIQAAAGNAAARSALTFMFPRASAVISALLLTASKITLSIGKLALAIAQSGVSVANVVGLDAIANEIDLKLGEFISKHFGENLTAFLGEGTLIAVSAGVGTALGGPIGALIGAIVGVVLDTINGGNWINGIWDAIIEKLFNWSFASMLLEKAGEFFNAAFKAESFLGFGANIVAGLATGIASAAMYLIEPINDLLIWIVNGICDIFGIHSPAETMKPYGAYILLGIIEGFRNTFNEWTASLEEWYTQYIAPWFTAKKWGSLYDTIKTALKNKWDETVGQWSADISAWWSTHVSPWFTQERWIEIADNFRSGIKSKWDETAGQWISDITGWWNNNVAPWFTFNKWAGIADNFRSGIKTKWNETVGQWISDITGWWNDNVSPWFTLSKWQEEAEHIKEAIIGKFGDAVKQWQEDISKWWDDDVEKWFTLEKWLEVMKELPNAFKKAFKDAVEAGKKVFDDFIDGIKRTIRNIFSDAEDEASDWDGGDSDDAYHNGPGYAAAASVAYTVATPQTISQYASGGQPDRGELYIARENGPELVGRIGGKPTVANNDQIVSAVSEGVADAVERVLLNNQDTNDSEPIVINVTVDGRTLSSVNANTKRRQGFQFRPA